MLAGDTAQLLHLAARGDKDAEAQLLPRVYGELHRLALNCLSRERKDHTLQPTALVNEAYLRIMGDHLPQVNDRSHFLALAAQAMRRILVDYARRRSAGKRGNGCPMTPIDDHLSVADKDWELVSEIAGALDELARVHPRAAKVVELRYFAGLTQDEAAEALHVAPKTANRDWAFARAWLFRYMSGNGDSSDE
ncbi:MAG TPA: ECF-type sigma factor [Bryobacteraceae bacterium]|nr:ECF-type sigma factor [Bryobacteraceae bacterium]